MKLAEYVSHGLPVLCSNLEGPSELVRGNGLLFDPELPASLSEAILCLFSERYPEFRSRAIEVANDEFSTSAVYRKISSLAERLEAASSTGPDNRARHNFNGRL